jgi:C1A family cysteine protease
VISDIFTSIVDPGIIGMRFTMSNCYKYYTLCMTFMAKLPYRYLGYVPSRPDERDFTLEHPAFASLMAAVPTVLPDVVDLRKICGPVLNQGNLGSCTANAAASVAAAVYMGDKRGLFNASRLQIYYNTRERMGTVKQDSGASISATMSALAGSGMAREILWPYSVTRYKVKPSVFVQKDAAERLITAYARIDQPGMLPDQVIYDIKKVLAAGHPVEFGCYVYAGIFGVKTKGIIPAPVPGENSIGGHAMAIVGYDTPNKRFLVQNSWGTAWGMKGFGWLPESYFKEGRSGQPDAMDVWAVTNAKWHY